MKYMIEIYVGEKEHPEWAETLDGPLMTVSVGDTIQPLWRVPPAGDETEDEKAARAAADEEFYPGDVVRVRAIEHVVAPRRPFSHQVQLYCDFEAGPQRP